MELNTNSSRGGCHKDNMKSFCAAQALTPQLVIINKGSLSDSIQLSIRPYPCPNARAVWPTCLLTFLREV